MSKAEIKTINLGDAFDLRAGVGTVNWATERDATTADALLNRNPSPLEEYIWHEFPNALGRKRIYLMLEPPNLVSLADKIKANIQVRKNNIIRKKS